MRVLYFFENNWVFGKIFNELIKFLSPDIDGDFLCWTRLYSPLEAELLRDKYDLYVSTPVGCFFLHDTYGWPLEKCYAHVHSEFDIDDALQRFPAEYFTKLAGYSAVSSPIWRACVDRVTNRTPMLLPVGVTTANYIREPSTQIRRLGYFGRMSRSDHGQPDIKRGELARAVAEQTGLEFYQHENVHFLAADQLYKHVDLVMFCSTTEGNPYVALEAAAAGVPILGTPVGIFPALAKTGAGVLLPLDADQLVAEAVGHIRRLQDDPDAYAKMSRAGRRASAAFDWVNIKALWIEEFRSACREARLRKDTHVLGCSS